MYDLAIIGGMGPEATAALFSRIVSRTLAASDQEHMTICVLSDARIPDRTAFLLGKGPDPLPRIMENIARARAAGCKHFVIPCNTAHHFADAYAAVEGITFINMVDAACALAKRTHPGKPVMVLGTHGTVQANVYGRAKEAAGLDIRYPSPAAQERVMAMITAVKGGMYDAAALARELVSMLESASSNEELVYILACTELSLLTPALQEMRPARFLDALDAAADSAILACGYRVRVSTHGV